MSARLDVTTTGINQDQCREEALAIGAAYFARDVPFNIVSERAATEAIRNAAGGTTALRFTVDYVIEEQS